MGWMGFALVCATQIIKNHIKTTLKTQRRLYFGLYGLNWNHCMQELVETSHFKMSFIERINTCRDMKQTKKIRTVCKDLNAHRHTQMLSLLSSIKTGEVMIVSVMLLVV